MVKRSNEASDAEEPYKKRQKLTKKLRVKYVATEIQSLHDLQTLLAFRQDTEARQFRYNIRNFKTFLKLVDHGEDSNQQSLKRAILLEYLQSQMPRAGDGQSRYLSDVIQSWSFAKQSNDEGLFCAIIAVLALLLKTMSNFIEFREHGNQLCKTLLEESQIKLINRCLNAIKIKRHVVFPCLQLLTEIVSFDGGVAAQDVYAHRDTIFKRLDTFLSIRKQTKEGVPENKQRKSVRNCAIWFLCANLRLQSRSTKSNILSDWKVIRALFQDIRKDSAQIVLDILNAFKKDVVQDLGLSHLVKGRVFTDWTLRQVSSLYQLPEHENDSDQITQVRHEAHALLISVCTTLDQGILKSQHKLDGQDEPDHDVEKPGLDEVTTVPKSQKHGLVRNVTLASFLQSLRPYADILQCELILALFRVAPDLIADYFIKKSFPFEPKLTTTWIGYSMFLLSVIQLPIPHWQFSQGVSGRIHAPFLSYLMIERILPQPLTKKALTRCLHQSTDLITFFAIRILIAAFQKLAKVLEILASISQVSGAESASIWKRAHAELVDEFCKRCPEMKHVIAVFRSCSIEHRLFKEAVTSLLTMYYKLLPQIALDEKLDISMALSGLLKGDSVEVEESHGDKLHKLELENLLEIARHSPDMRWWRKPDDMLLSPFTTILRLHVTSPKSNADDRIRNLLQSIASDTTILRPYTNIHSLDILLQSLQDSQRGHASDSLFEFLDNCLLRCQRKPVKYYDDLTTLVHATKADAGEISGCNIDLLFITILDQWPYFVKSAMPAVLEDTIRWLVRYLDLSMYTGSDITILSKLRDQLKIRAMDNCNCALLNEALRTPSRFIRTDELKETDKSSQEASNGARIQFTNTLPDSLEELLIPGIPSEDEDHPALGKWMKRDIPQAIKDGEIGELVLYLSSKHEDIRKQAIISLRAFAGNLKTSEYTERQQTYVLIGEVIEVAKDLIPDSPLPYFAGVLASESLLILSEPLHFMYAKVNKFLNKSPCWVINKLPSYWVDRILLHPPADDNAYYGEVEWLLELLINSLRTPDDMELYRRCHILERILSMSAVSLPRTCNAKLLDLLIRCTLVGGSTTLITRCGLLSWIQSRINSSYSRASDHATLRQLAIRAYETSDRERVNLWSGGGVRRTLESLK